MRRHRTVTALSLAAAAVALGAQPRPARAAHFYIERTGRSTWGSLTAWNPNLSLASYYSSATLNIFGTTVTVPDWYEEPDSSLNVLDPGVVGSQTMGWSFHVSSVTFDSPDFFQLAAGGTPRWLYLETGGAAITLGSSAVTSFTLGTLGDPMYVVLGSGPSVEVTGAQRTLTVNAAVFGTGFVKTGDGVLRLTNNSNAYAGNTVINAGTLAISLDHNLGDTGGTLYLNGGTLRADASFSLSPSRTVNLAGGGTIDTGANNLTVAGTLAGNGTLVKQGSGTLAITGTKTGTGEIRVSGGALQVGANLITGSTSAYSFVGYAGNGTLSQTGGTSTYNSAGLVLGYGTSDVGAYNLQNASSLVVGSASNAANLYVGYDGQGTFNQSGTSANTVYGTVYVSNGTSAYALSGGTLLAGGAENYGTFAQSGGSLTTFGTANFGTFAQSGGAEHVVYGTLYNAAGATYTLSGAASVLGTDPTYGPASVVNDGTFTQSGGTAVLDNVSGTGTFALSGGTLALWGSANALNGLTFALSGGTLQTNANISTTAPFALSAPGGGTFGPAASTSLTLAGNVTGSGTLTLAGPGTLVLTGTNTYSGGTTISAGTLQIGNGGSTGSVTGTILNNGTLVLNRSGTILSGVVSGSGSLVKLGTGAATLSGNNTYTGGTTVSGGTLNVSGSGTLGTGPVVNNGTIAYIRGTDSTIAGNISGTGGLTKSFFGSTLTLTGNNTFTGNTTISAGAIRYNAANSLGGSGATITLSGGAAVAGYAVDQAFVDRVTTGSVGTVGLAVNSSNNLDLSARPGVTIGAVGNVTYGGTITPPTSTHKVSLSGGAAGSSLTVASADIASPAFLALSGTVKVTGSSTFAYPDSFGTLVLDPGAGNSITMMAGHLSTTPAFTGTITVSSGTAVIAGYNTYLDGNAPSIVKTGPGTLDMQSYQTGGDVTVSEGTLSVESSVWEGSLHNAATVTSQWLTEAQLGDYTQSAAGTLVVEIRGTTFSTSGGGGYDRYDGRTASLAGTLHIDLIDGFVPGNGDSFQILSFSSISGDFDDYDLPSLDPGLYWDHSSLTADGTISVTDVAPFAPLSLSLIPEPAGLGLLASGTLALGSRRRRRRR